jgi:(Z)-2-((N-methylformamido)methylene)-5-hydroxybutyrolactone dehydrogenase
VSANAAYELYVGGEWLPAASGATFESVEPATGEAWATIPDAGQADVDRAVAAARRAFDDDRGPWRSLTASQRGKLLLDLAYRLESEADRLAAIESRDCGKLLKEARGQIGALPAWYRFFGGLADKIDGRVPPYDFPTVLNYITREPVGVVAAMAAWNSPLMLATWKLAPALATGCTIVVKPSEVASASMLELARLFEEVGFPAGVVNVITGDGPATGAALVAHPDVDHVSFTGGPAAARSIARAAAENLTPTSFELGGKSANIVFEDADLDAAVPGTVGGIFAAAGQTCVAGSRSLVHRDVYDDFLERLVAAGRELRVGAPDADATQVGPIVTERHLGHIAGLVDGARAEGASIALGGERVSVEGLPNGTFYAPTIVTDVTPRMTIAQEEVFGPVLAVLSFADEDEAVAIANSTRYSLAAGLWTRDVKRAHRVARRLRAGTVWVNTYRTASPMTPHGGAGLSGHGRENGIEAVDEFLAPKSVLVELG